jgi:alkylation response protein AidB-like acyl-CoA dehydrogenase
MTMMEVIEAVSMADGGAGWTVMIGIEVLGVAAGYVPEDTMRTILTTEPATIAAGAINPLGRAVPTEGGFVVDGRWPFASGIHNADWWWGGCMVDDGTDRRPRQAIQVLVPRGSFEIIDTWDVAGLAGSGSHDVAVTDQFVPLSHVSTMPGPPANRTEPIFRMPVMSRLAFNKIGVATGIARSAIDDFVALAGEKTPRGERSVLAERPRAQLAVAEAEALLCSGRAWVFEVVEELWDHALAGRPVSDELHARVRLSCAHAVQSSVRAVETVHSAAGASVNFRSSPLERRFRDVHVVPQQITVAPHLIEAAGRVLLGLDPGQATF